MWQFLLYFFSLLLPGATAAPAASAPNAAETCVIFGDSMTWLGGDDCSKPKGWTSYFAAAHPDIYCLSYARSGATMTNTNLTKLNTEENSGIITDCNTIYNQVQRFASDLKAGKVAAPKIIIIGAGANDVWFEKKRPGLFAMSPEVAMSLDSARLVSASPTEALSLASALRQNLLLLRKLAPDARIIVLAPNQSASIDTGRIHKAAEIIEAVARAEGADVFRQDLFGPISAASEKRQKKLTYDGTHTSQAGAKALGNCLTNAVDSIMALPAKAL